MTTDEVRRCEYAECRAEFTRLPGQRMWNFRHKRFCSPSCAQSSRVGAQPVKTCALPECGREFTRRRGQPLTTFESRRFCSPECGRKGQKRPGQGPSDVCRGESRHPMVGDNVLVDVQGRRRCRACAREYEARKAKAGGRTRKPRASARQSTPKPAVVPAAVLVERPVWRPAGWGPVPVIVPKERAS